MRRRLHVLLLCILLPATGCLYKYSWERGWQRNEDWMPSIDIDEFGKDKTQQSPYEWQQSESEKMRRQFDANLPRQRESGSNTVVVPDDLSL